MPLLLMKLIFASLGKPPIPFGLRALGSVLGQGVQKTWLNRQLETHARYIESHLAENSWFAGDAALAGRYFGYGLFRPVDQPELPTSPTTSPAATGGHQRAIR